MTKEELEKSLDFVNEERERLQQENQELNDNIEWWNNRFNAVQRDYENYKSRIEKAVEYIKENAKYKKVSINDRKYYSEYLINQVLDILNGKE